MRLFLVEDDQTIAQAIATTFSRYDYDVHSVENFSDVMPEFNTFQPDLVLMDVNLPEQNGFHWCQRIREQSHVPIVFLSSITENMDMLMAMQMGADDYITKPVEMSLLVTKVQALLRRTYDYAINDQVLNAGDVSLSLTDACVNYQGKQLPLTFTELQILNILFKQRGTFVSRTAILDYCWQNDQFIDDNTLAVNISRIRKKLKTIGLADIIETKKKMGYRLIVEDA